MKGAHVPPPRDEFHRQTRELNNVGIMVNVAKDIIQGNLPGERSRLDNINSWIGLGLADVLRSAEFSGTQPRTEEG